MERQTHHGTANVPLERQTHLGTANVSLQLSPLKIYKWANERNRCMHRPTHLKPGLRWVGSPLTRAEFFHSVACNAGRYVKLSCETKLGKCTLQFFFIFCVLLHLRIALDAVSTFQLESATGMANVPWNSKRTWERQTYLWNGKRTLERQMLRT